MTIIGDLRRQGENSAVEFKSASVRPESLAKEMVAFANTRGGSILLGLEDDGSVGGLPAGFDYEQWVANIARNNVVPSLDVATSTHLVEGKNILLIEVPKGRDKPYQTSTNQFLNRVGSTNRIAAQQELMRLFQQAENFPAGHSTGRSKAPWQSSRTTFSKDPPFREPELSQSSTSTRRRVSRDLGLAAGDRHAGLNGAVTHRRCLPNRCGSLVRPTSSRAGSAGPGGAPRRRLAHEGA